MTDQPTTERTGSTTSTPTGNETAEKFRDSLPDEVENSVEMYMRKAMKRENAQDKSRRLLVSGRLRVVKVDGALIIAECRGDSGAIYHLGHEPGARKPWRCTCPAVGPCSHLYALWAVTAV